MPQWLFPLVAFDFAGTPGARSTQRLPPLTPPTAQAGPGRLTGSFLVHQSLCNLVRNVASQSLLKICCGVPPHIVVPYAPAFLKPSSSPPCNGSPGTRMCTQTHTYTYPHIHARSPMEHILGSLQVMKLGKDKYVTYNEEEKIL